MEVIRAAIPRRVKARSPLYQASNYGQGNTAIGYGTLNVLTTGNFNTAVGYLALSISTANQNTAVGAFALELDTSGTKTAPLEF